MKDETISREYALALIEKAKKAAATNYKGERLQGVRAGLNIAFNLISNMEPSNSGKDEVYAGQE